MKKKITKSYFFKNNNSTRIIRPLNYVFCFSKKHVKQVKKYNFFSKNTNKIKKSNKDIFVKSVDYKNVLMTKMFYKHWINLNVLSKNKFIFNKCISHNYVNKNKKFWLYLWFLLNIKKKTTEQKKLLKHNSLGIISSHYTHFFLRKNITYQIKSKYYSQVFNTTGLSVNVKSIVNHLNRYFYFKKSNLFWFTKTFEKKHCLRNEDQHIVVSNWYKINTKKDKYIYITFNLNFDDFVLKNILEIKKSFKNILKKKIKSKKELEEIVKIQENKNNIELYIILYNFLDFSEKQYHNCLSAHYSELYKML